MPDTVFIFGRQQRKSCLVRVKSAGGTEELRVTHGEKEMIIHNSELDISLGVFHLNSHKKPILGVKSGNKIVKYASFDNDLKAEYFMEILIDFFGVRQEA